MFRRCLTLVALLFAAASPAHALRVGQELPAPPTHAIDGSPLPTDRWLREELVVWYLFTPGGPDAPHALRWLPPPPRGRPGYRAVGVPISAAPMPPSQGAAATFPLLGDGHRWQPQLGLRMQPPVVIVTRPPGVVAHIYEGADAAGSALALFALGLHVQREDWTGVLEIISRAGDPVVDPTMRAARGLAAIALKQDTLAGAEATGLAEVGPNAVFKAVGHVLLAEIALRTGDMETAAAEATAGAAIAEAQVVLARIALAQGDITAAQQAAQRAHASKIALPWSAGDRHLLSADLAGARGDVATARKAARAASQAAPGSWRVWQALGLAQLRAGDGEGVALLQAAAALAPRDMGASALATAAVHAVSEDDDSPPTLSLALEAGSIGHGTWPAVGVTAEILLADALGTRVLGTARAYTMSPLAWHAGKPFGAPLDATTGLAAARHAKARYFVLLRMQPGPRGVILNARVADVRSGALRALESMVWTPDLTLPQACDALAKRIRARLQE